jgi:triosephosphate isomerase
LGGPFCGLFLRGKLPYNRAFLLAFEMRQKLVVGNWKMHGHAAANQQRVRDILLRLTPGPNASLDPVEIAICPPFPYLQSLAQMLEASPVALGAQNVSEHPQGAYTGEVSAAMLFDVGCRYVIVGHSERRTLYGEGDATVFSKVKAAQSAGLTPIICVGESREEREAGVTEAVVGAQVLAQIEALRGESVDQVGPMPVLAYEPLWAIGTGLTASPEEAQATHAFIRGILAARSADHANRVKILYGGSVKPQNAAEIFAMPDIDGGLIGGASLVPEDFLAIVSAAGRA